MISLDIPRTQYSELRWAQLYGPPVPNCFWIFSYIDIHSVFSTHLLRTAIAIFNVECILGAQNTIHKITRAIYIYTYIYPYIHIYIYPYIQIFLLHISIYPYIHIYIYIYTYINLCIIYIYMYMYMDLHIHVILVDEAPNLDYRIGCGQD